jgi:hypothetical protein
VEFDTNFQELMKFEQGAHVCTWIIDQVLKQNLEFQLGEFFSIHFQNLIQICLKLALVYLGFGLII